MGRDFGPAYKHFIKISENILTHLERFKCRYCGSEYKRNHTKMLHHLKVQCKKVPEFIKQQLSHVSTTTSHDAIPSTASSVPENPAFQNLEAATTMNRNSDIGMLSFVDLISSKEQEELERGLARAIFSSGSACSLFESDVWQQFFNRLRPSFKLPGRNKIGGFLLDEEHSRMVNHVNAAINDAKFLSIQCDSWTNIRSESIVNMIVSTPTSYLYDSISTGSEPHDGEFYSQRVSEVIEKVGPKKVIGLVTDNASVMKKSWRLLTERYPHLIAFGCVAHGLNLLCKDIIDIPRLKKLEKTVNSIVKVFKKSALLSGRIKELSSQKGSEKIELKLSNKTRWVSTLLSFTSLIKSKSFIRQIAVDSKYEGSLGQEKLSQILRSGFWDDLAQTVEIMRPIAKWIILFQTENKPMLHLVYPAFQEIKRKISSFFETANLKDREKQAILASIRKRQKFCITPAHLAAHLLDSNAQGSELSPTQTHGAIDFLFKWTQKISPQDVNRVMAELAEFRSKTGVFSSASYIWSMKSSSVNVVQWWGLSSGKLAIADIAMGLLNINPTTATTERSFSTFKYIQSAKRNRLTNERAGKLVFLCHNLKLESSRQPNRLQESLNYLGIDSVPNCSEVDPESSAFSHADIAPADEFEMDLSNESEDETLLAHVCTAEASSQDSLSDDESVVVEEQDIPEQDEEEEDEISELYRLATSANYLFHI